MAALPAKLAARILAALPQTQCTRCGYADCAAYAQAVSDGSAGINQCPPGGSRGIAVLAELTDQPFVPLDPRFGIEGPRTTVFVDEDWCIGCTLCIAACPTDAILGSSQRMHTVIEAYCTGCELCLPVCPVDCLVVENATGTATGWAAWSQPQADLARERYAASRQRRLRAKEENDRRLVRQAQHKLQDLAAHSRTTDTKVLDRKRATIEAAMQRARAKRG